MLQTRRALPLDLSHAFARFRGADPERLHFAATAIISGRT
jgi:hypothetical protein